MATSRAWSNAFNIGCTFVVAYSLLVLAAMHHHRVAQHGPRGHPEPHPHNRHGCPVEHFAWLALATGLTGLLAGCTMKKRFMYAFPVLLLITELFVLVHISRGAVHAVQRCTEQAERVNEVITLSRTDIAPGLALMREDVAISQPYVDERVREHCVEGVRHSVVLACLIVGAVCSALMCCGARLVAAKVRDDADAERNNSSAVLVVTAVEADPAAKPDPLAEGDDDDESAPLTGRVVLIRRV